MENISKRVYHNWIYFNVITWYILAKWLPPVACNDNDVVNIIYVSEVRVLNLVNQNKIAVRYEFKILYKTIYNLDVFYDAFGLLSDVTGVVQPLND